MKRLLLCTAICGLALSPAAQAKGCIKGAIVGGIAGHMAGNLEKSAQLLDVPLVTTKPTSLRPAPLGKFEVSAGSKKFLSGAASLLADASLMHILRCRAVIGIDKK